MTANFRRFDFSIRRQRSWFHPCVINKFDKFMERVSGKHPSIPVRQCEARLTFRFGTPETVFSEYREHGHRRCPAFSQVAAQLRYWPP
jgi:hypothetical protein